MMGRLLEAVRPQARLVLVGDPRPADLGRGRGGARPTWSRGYEGDRLAGRRAHRELPLHRATSRRSPRRCASATPTRCSARCGAARREVEFVETDDAGAALRADALGSALAVAPGRRGRRPRGRAWPRSTSTACSAPTARGRTAYATGTGRSSSGSPSELGLPSPAEWYVGRPLLVTSNDYALRDLQRRDRCGGARARRPAAGLDLRLRRPARLRARAARRRRDDARDDDPQEPGQPGPAGHRAAARRRTPGCSPASSSTPPSPGPRSTSGSSARRRRCGPRSRPRPSARPASGSGWPRRVRPETETWPQHDGLGSSNALPAARGAARRPRFAGSPGHGDRRGRR